jgi:5-hydroxyisourate hydrolase
MPAKISTHVLDLAHGCPASGMKIELWLLDAGEPTLLTTAKTNADGRTDAALLAGDEVKTGRYEIIFFVGDYFVAKSPTLPKIRFLDRVPVPFGVADAGASYHIPLICSPWSYTTYRGA